MIGAIAGDIIGSIYEFDNIRTKDFPLFQKRCYFTDDSVCTIALADAILHDLDYTDLLKKYFKLYPNSGFGGYFYRWASSDDRQPYYSFGNGAAMRISPVGYAFDTLEEVLEKARTYTSVTHNHPEGIKGAQATATCIFLARNKKTKNEIKDYVTRELGYDLSRTCDEIRPKYKFNETCQETVPQAITSYLESTGYEDAIRNAISLGGDSDTLACITGGIAQAEYGVPDDIQANVYGYLDERLAAITREFMAKNQQ